MEFDKSSGFSGYSSMLMGAIFMSNLETKKECFKRNIFALPASYEKVVKKIRKGMILFLFEFQERKLYGVYEAASNGGLNIIQNAFNSAGNKFPAQVCIKRLWNCYPLSESHFRGAIKENYYTTQKFNFELSGEQVSKLLHLFELRKVRTWNNMSITTSTDDPGPNRYKSTGDQMSLSCQMDPHKKKNMTPRRYNGSYWTNARHSECHEESHLGTDGYVAGVEPLIYSKFSPVDKPRSGDSCCLMPQKDRDYSIHDPRILLQSSRMSTAISSFQHEHLPFTFHMDILPQKLSTSPRNTTQTEVPFRSHLYQSYPDPGNVFSGDYLPLNNSISPQSYTDLLSPSQRLSSSRESFLDSNNRMENRLSVNVEDYYGRPAYDLYVPTTSRVPSKPENYVGLQEGALTSVYSSSAQLSPRIYPYGASQLEDSSKRLRYWDHEGISVPEAERSDNMVSSSSLKHRLDEKQCVPLKCDTGYVIDSTVPQFSIQDDEFESASANRSEVQRVQKPTVFSRLSKAPKSLPVGSGLSEANEDSSLEQVMGSLLKRYKLWKNTGISKAWISQIGEKRSCSNDIPLEQAQTSSFDSEKCCDEDVNGQFTTTQFINFKRRSRVCLGGGSESSKLDECSSAKQKRRKLVRPSFCSEPFLECSSDGQNGQIIDQESMIVVSLGIESGNVSIGNNSRKGDGSKCSTVEVSEMQKIHNISSASSGHKNIAFPSKNSIHDPEENDSLGIETGNASIGNKNSEGDGSQCSTVKVLEVQKIHNMSSASRGQKNIAFPFESSIHDPEENCSLGIESGTASTENNKGEGDGNISSTVEVLEVEKAHNIPSASSGQKNIAFPSKSSNHDPEENDHSCS